MDEFKDAPAALTALQRAWNGIDDAYWNHGDMAPYIADAEAALAYLKERAL